LSYIDASVMVLALDPSDPRSSRAKERLEREGYKVISELVLVELSSVISKRRELLRELSNEIQVDEGKLIPAILLYMVKRFNLTYRSTGASKPALPGLGRIYEPMLTAIELSGILRLKTLDLLHVAYIVILKNRGERISLIVTGDEDFKKAEAGLARNLKINIELID